MAELAEAAALVESRLLAVESATGVLSTDIVALADQAVALTERVVALETAGVPSDDPRFATIEGEIAAINARIDAITLPPVEPPPPTTGFTAAEINRLRAIIAANEGVLYIDQFTGTDVQRLAAAVAEHKLSRLTVDGLRPTIVLPPRRFRTGKIPDRFTNMHILGPLGSHGLLSMEQGDGHGINHRWEVAGCGIGDAAFLADRDDGANVYHQVMERIAFKAVGGGQQFLNWQAGSNYSHSITDCSFIGFQHVIGNPTSPSRSTALILDGKWNVHGGTGTQFTITGSDHNLWEGGWLNMQLSGGSGEYMMILDCDKSTAGDLFLTACDKWRALWVKSGCDGLDIVTGRFEGKESGPACYGTLVRISGDINFWGTKFGFYMTNPGANNPASPDKGGIYQDGGDALLVGCKVWPTPGSPAASSDVATIVKHPFYYLAGGHAEILHCKGKGGFKPTVVHAGGTLIRDDSVIVRRPDGTLV